MLVSAQKIIIDSQENGVRAIATDMEVCKNKMSDKIVLSVGISAFVDSETGKQQVCLDTKVTSSSPIKVNKGGRCLIKLMDDTVIELSASLESNGNVRDVHNVNGFVFHDYSASPTFDLSMEQLEQIAAKGVKKIKIESLPDNLENEYKKDKIGKAVKERLPLLKKALETSKGFSDGF